MRSRGASLAGTARAGMSVASASQSWFRIWLLSARSHLLAAGQAWPARRLRVGTRPFSCRQSSRSSATRDLSRFTVDWLPPSAPRTVGPPGACHPRGGQADGRDQLSPLGGRTRHANSPQEDPRPACGLPLPRRHYFASLLSASGADVKTVQARLRHASAKTTLDTYGHVSPDRDESTRAAVDAVITARTEPWRNSDESDRQRRRSRPGLAVRRRSRARTRAGAGAAGVRRARRSACSPARSRSGPR